MTVLMGGNSLINSDMMRFRTDRSSSASILPAPNHLSSEISYKPGITFTLIVGVGDSALTFGRSVLCLCNGAAKVAQQWHD